MVQRSNGAGACTSPESNEAKPARIFFWMSEVSKYSCFVGHAKRTALNAPNGAFWITIDPHDKTGTAAPSLSVATSSKPRSPTTPW